MGSVAPLLTSVQTFLTTASRERNALIVGLATTILLKSSAYPAGAAVAAYVYFQPDQGALRQYLDIPFRVCYRIAKTFTLEENPMQQILGHLQTIRTMVQTPAQKALVVGLAVGILAEVPYVRDVTGVPFNTPHRRAALIAIGAAAFVFYKWPSISLTDLEKRTETLIARGLKFWNAPTAAVKR